MYNKSKMNGMSLAEKLLIRQQVSKAKLQKLRETTEMAKYQDCSFKPQTNFKKKHLKSDKENSYTTRYV